MRKKVNVFSFFVLCSSIIPILVCLLLYTTCAYTRNLEIWAQNLLLCQEWRPAVRAGAGEEGAAPGVGGGVRGPGAQRPPERGSGRWS